jgi:hypothetical protein
MPGSARTQPIRAYVTNHRSVPILIIEYCLHRSTPVYSNRQPSAILRLVRGSTPMHADAAWASPGFSGALPSGPRSHLANTTTGCAFAPLRFAPAAPGHGSLQALSDTPSAVSIARPPPHPSHRCAYEGPSARKTLRDRGEASATACYWPHDKVRSWLSVLLRGRVRVFAALAPLHAKRCRWVRRWRGEKRCQRRVFQGLRRSRDSASKKRAVSVRRGCKPVRDTEAPKKLNSTCPQGTGVDRRIIRDVLGYF